MGAAHHRGTSEQSVQTPPEFIHAVKRSWGLTEFYWDLAADLDNRQAPNFFDEAQDALQQTWPTTAGREVCWLNPPYANIGAWVKKAAQSPQCRTLMLLPASVGTNWYRDWVFPYAATIVLNGRIKFIGHKDPYPKDLMLLDYAYGYNAATFALWRWNDSAFVDSPSSERLAVWLHESGTRDALRRP